MFSLTGKTSPRIFPLPGNVLELVKPANQPDPGVFMCTLRNGLTSFILYTDDYFMLTSDGYSYWHDAGFSLLKAQIDPENADLLLTAVPLERGNELLTVRWERRNPEILSAEDSYDDAVLSPDGEKAFMYTRKSFAVLSVPDDRFVTQIELVSDESNPDFSYGDPVAFTSDGNHVIRGKYVISLENGKVDPLPLPDNFSWYRPVTAWVPSLGKAVTAVMAYSYAPELGTDGSIGFVVLLDGAVDRGVVVPDGYMLNKSILEKSLWVLGGNGLLLMRGILLNDESNSSVLLVYDTLGDEWKPVSEKVTVSPSAKATAANRENWVALLDGNRLSMYDPESDMPLWEAESLCSSESVSGLWPSPDDRLLLVTYGKQRVAIYRTSDGKLLGDLPFDMSDIYVPRIQLDSDGRLYLSHSGASVNSQCVVLNAETGDLICEIPTPVFVNLRTRKVYRYPQTGSGMVLYPLYTRDELRELAKQKINP